MSSIFDLGHPGAIMFTDGTAIFYDYYAASKPSKCSMSHLCFASIHELVHIWLDHCQIIKSVITSLQSLGYPDDAIALASRLCAEPAANYIPTAMRLKPDYPVVTGEVLERDFRGIDYKKTVPSLARDLADHINTFGFPEKYKPKEDGPKCVIAPVAIVSKGWVERMADVQKYIINVAPFFIPLVSGDGIVGPGVRVYGCLFMTIPITPEMSDAELDEELEKACNAAKEINEDAEILDIDFIRSSCKEQTELDNMAGDLIPYAENKDPDAPTHEEIRDLADLVTSNFRHRSIGNIPGWFEANLDIREKRESAAKLLAWIQGQFNDLIVGRWIESWSIRPRRLIDPRLIMPGSGRMRARVLVIVDSSGSMIGKPIKDALSEVMGLLSLPQFETEVVAYDAALQEIEINRLNGNVRLTGFGGTDMAEAIARYKQDLKLGKYDAMVVITDGLTPWPISPVNRVYAVIVDPEAPYPPAWIKTFHYRNYSEFLGGGSWA